MYDNKVIQTEANEIVDLSESNPFGSITWRQQIIHIIVQSEKWLLRSATYLMKLI
jgi:hypothetical protein